MSQTRGLRDDPFAYVDTVYERPARARAVSPNYLSEEAEGIQFMVNEGGHFEPTYRRNMAETSAPLPEVDTCMDRPKKKKKAAQRNAADETEGRDREIVATELWDLVQAGLEAGWDDEELIDGFLQHTPEEMVKSLRPLHLRDYQRHAVNRILAALLRGKKGFLLAYDMGLGKTVIVIGMSLVTLDIYHL
jgi:SNF2 family DNA or RNA helicase